MADEESGKVQQRRGTLELLTTSIPSKIPTTRMKEAWHSFKLIFERQERDKLVLVGTGLTMALLTLGILLLPLFSKLPAPPPISAIQKAEALKSLEDITVARPQTRSAEWRTLVSKLSEQMLNQSTAVDILFIGDHWETWQGTEMGYPCDEGSVCLQTAESIPTKYTQQHILSSSISEDTTSNLLWRISQASSGFSALNPHLCVLHLGTHDLTRGHTPVELAAGVRMVLTQLRTHMLYTHFLIVGILPRADDIYQQKVAGGGASGGMFNFGVSKPTDPNELFSISFDESQYFHKIVQSNEWLKAIADEVPSNFMRKPPVFFLDCSREFMVPQLDSHGAHEIPLKLMPDGLHLSLAGQEKLHMCMYDTLTHLAERAHQIRETRKVSNKFSN
mmetsp:Transcript_1474/g.2110  ORF Transcript_1474/g.2110 Transcript_1474/m.2110 type:complete len:390 (-) Transcript_1474:97-1266(-)|eukprot:CAMPEP_0196581516 /NCGR_PEP_ID=MMETSP1081-20130531/34012_1 /TAXON_ID=36882 /ORGANISM="Pyramimonas amylifera, Strain CCMP720" /LENGTH=389 /DNA_ID=CAMNT_0041901773 /DNA_START=82 /DNA_END=1251 /DNA_ORIENTATION=+